VYTVQGIVQNKHQNISDTVQVMLPVLGKSIFFVLRLFMIGYSYIPDDSVLSVFYLGILNHSDSSRIQLSFVLNKQSNIEWLRAIMYLSN
jgi:hypothetical protein